MTDEITSKKISRRSFLNNTTVTVLSIPFIMGVCAPGATKVGVPCPDEVAVPRCPDNIRVGSGSYLRIGHMCGNIF